MPLTTAHSMTTMSLPMSAISGNRTPAALRAPIAALTDALRSETRLLDELVSVMRRQREAVGADDLQSVDDSVFATHRVLLTISEARRRRKALNRLISDDEDLPLGELDEVLGDWMTAELRASRDALQAAALVLSREVETNRRLLRQALAHGEDYVRALSGTPDTTAGYGRNAGHPPAPHGGGLLLNRTA
jgi:hypothetical protein